MKKYLLRLFIFLICATAFSTVYAQDGTIGVGLDQKLIFGYPWDEYMNTPNYSFPEAMVSSHSAVRVAYFPDEMGKEPQNLVQMKMPFLPNDFMDGSGDLNPIDFWDYLIGVQSNAPLDVAIYMRNSTSYPYEESLVDTSAANGWVKVWDGVYDFGSNEFDYVEVTGWGATFPALVIDFDEPFFYEGEVLEIIFVNQSGVPSLITDDYGYPEDLNWDDIHYMYPFLTYYSDYEQGAAWSGYNMVWEPYYYFIEGFVDDWSFPPLKPTYFINSTMYDNYFRPMIEFTYQNDMVIKSIKSQMPNIVKIDEYNYGLMELNINTVSKSNPIEINSLEFQVYSNLGLGKIDFAENITKAKLYYTDKTSSFNMNDAKLIGEYTFKGTIGKDEIFVIDFSKTLELGEGANYFWLVYEIPTTNKCDDYLSAQLNVIETNNEDINFKGLEHAYYTQIQYEPIDISRSNVSEYTICRALDSYTIQLIVTGAANEEFWEGSNDGENWVEINNNSTKKSTLTFSDFDYEYIRYNAYGPKGCPNSEASFNMHIKYVDAIGAVAVVCNSDVDLQAIYVGEELEFEALVDNVPPAVPTSYRWQINNIGVWNDISEEEVPSAVTSKLQITADKETYYGSVRCIVNQIDLDNPESCQLEFVSEPIRFSVSDADFYYTESPVKKSTICEGGEFELYFAYFGIIVDGYWTHNGGIMYDENGNRYTEQILTLKNISPSDEGIYNYVATAYTRNEDGEVEMTEHITRDAELYVISQNSILEQPEKETFAPMGSTIILEFVADVRGEYDYQWYRKTVAGDVALENNHKYNGVKANALVINYLDPSDFTYNGDYFYCKINGQCGITTTEPAYLFTQETQLYIAQQPQDVNVCLRDDSPIELTVDILQKSNTLEYQWYKDDQALVDDTRIKGSKTSHLVITPSLTSDYGKYWVVSREISTGSEVKSNEVLVTVRELTLLEQSDTLIYVHEGDSVPLYRDKFRASNGTFTSEVKFNGSILRKGTHKMQYTPSGSAEIECSDPGFSSIKPEECGLYEIRFYNDCDTILHTVLLILVDQDGNPIETVTSGIKDYKNGLDFNISPNPVNSKINLVFESLESNTRIDLLDISGSNLVTVFDGMLESGSHTISYDLSKLNLSSGTYFIKLVQGSSVQVKPFIFTK